MIKRDRQPAPTEHTTVLAGPGQNISLEACAHEIMNQAGLRCLKDTYAAIRAAKSSRPISVTVNPRSNEIQINDVASGTLGWVVVEQFGNGAPPRGWLFSELRQAAAYFGAKLTLQGSGAVTIRQDPGFGLFAAHYVGTGSSRITGITMSRL